ncbi:hypothetical protein H2200_009480 [Cladophialophora chaetospira]|uniref:Uncharacterized protein n=1 Tax=Cladophialophora chaetospira TaxID=386627 RepID=A0AA39CET3_9EURO|nr:hypothetical protein H2200_009480 [Cladophialophora chaetospira]
MHDVERQWDTLHSDAGSQGFKGCLDDTKDASQFLNSHVQMNMFRRREDFTSSELDPHEWNRARTEFQVSSKHPKTAIPDSAIFRDVIVPAFDQVRNGAQLRYPNPGHLAVHLALGECFMKFKEKAIISPELNFLEAPQYEEGKPEKDLTSEIAQAEERWKTVVRLAVSRFAVWFENIESVLRHAAAYHRYGPNSNAHHAAITADYLPPLDVLMVWYAYMNNPSEYRNDNLASKLLEMPMPWEAVLNVIDMESLTYKLRPAASRLFATTTTQDADILVYLTQPPPYSELDPHNAFSTDLIAAVHELMDGDSFIQKMHALLWLRSPSLEGTLSRGLARYSALPQATGSSVAAWLDGVNSDVLLELVWRTHMLYPAVYAAYREEVFQGSEAESNLREERDWTDQATCYCWACERVRDDIPDYVRASDFETLDDRSEGSNRSLSMLDKDQISEIKADLAFHRYVEVFHNSHPSGTTLPTRAPTARAIQRQISEQESKDRAGKYYGVGYTVEVIRPAVYDKETGKLLRKQKTKVKRSQNMTGRWGRWGLYV